MTSEGIEPFTWARGEAQRLRRFSISAVSRQDEPRATSGDLAAGIDFLRGHAGASSAFAQAAEAVLTAGPINAWAFSHELADLLDRWCDWAATGLAGQQPFEVLARVAAASDLMEYVSELLQDRKSHPAAIIVLAGAGLEERLRALLDEDGIAPSGRGLDAYGADLKKTGTITSHEAKQITAWAGLRNQAAHGENLDELTRAQAQNMADGVNLFMQAHDLSA